MKESGLIEVEYYRTDRYLDLLERLLRARDFEIDRLEFREDHFVSIRRQHLTIAFLSVTYLPCCFLPLLFSTILRSMMSCAHAIRILRPSTLTKTVTQQRLPAIRDNISNYLHYGSKRT